MSEELIHSVIDQVDAHEKKISELNEKLNYFFEMVMIVV